MSKFQSLLDETNAVDASTVVNSSQPWKDSIIEFMTSQKDPYCTDQQILENTDPKFTGENFNARKHCLDSQFTYLKQDYNIVVRRVDKKRALLGIRKEDKVMPFKNAVKLLK